MTNPLARVVAGVAAVLTLASCARETDRPATDPLPAATPPTVTSRPTPTPDPVVMPDVTGLLAEVAALKIVRLDPGDRRGLGTTWERPVLVGCETRPGTIVRQHPPAGTLLRAQVEIRVREAAMDLTAFRGPCEPTDGDLGPVTGAEAALAREFYRFAADPSLGGPFAYVDIWVGIEGGPTAVRLGAAERASLNAWIIHTGYAERSGPFSPLDVVASSGGYFEVHEGIPGCAGTTDDVPDELVGLRAITLTPPRDTVGACMEWWGVTLFLDENHLIRGVALRLGSP